MNHDRFLLVEEASLLLLFGVSLNFGAPRPDPSIADLMEVSTKEEI